MSYMGFKLNCPEEIKLSKGPYTSDHLREIGKKNKLITSTRGKIIGACLTLERRLDGFISDSFVNKKKRTLFKELILDKESFTLMSKWKLFREITHIVTITNITEEERKKLLSLSKELIETRNRFAHGSVTFSGTIPRLHFLSSGKKKEIDVDKKYLSDIEKKFVKSIELFDKLTNFKYVHKD